MATKKKMLQAAAGNATGGAGLDITDVFSTYVEATGAGTTTVDQGIDLSGEGGLWWGKIRNLSGDPDGRHELHDTERGAGNYLRSDSTAAETASSFNFLSSFTSTGYTGWSGVNGYDVASWTFRKAPKFFDVVTYTGDGVAAGKTISHNLNQTVGCIMVKNLDEGDRDWRVYHRGVNGGTTPENYYLSISQTSAQAGADTWQYTQPTSSEFYVKGELNRSGINYVAYLFAHNDGDGEFGPNGDQDIIKCGSYTGDGSGLATVDLGFEPQWVMIKRAGTTSNWEIIDTMRGFPTNPIGAGTADNARLFANLSNAESGFPMLGLTSTGFVTGASWGAGEEVIYIAIRRGPLAPPESGTEVFAVDLSGSTAPRFESSFPVDMAFWRPTVVSNTKIASRLTGNKSLLTNDTSLEDSANANVWDFMDGFYDGGITSNYAWMWKRAPNFFDVVAYTGNGTAGRDIPHNLGVAPEMIWVKQRDNSRNWAIYHSSIGNTGGLLFTTTATQTTSNLWDDTSPQASLFTLGQGNETNRSGGSFIAYLFASLDGVSKVFSVTKSSGSDASVNCGFSSGPRFVMLKRTDSTGDWYIWDTERGIVAGNDPYLLLNSTAAEVTSTDYIDPTSNGFTIVNGGLADGDYIGYAVA